MPESKTNKRDKESNNFLNTDSHPSNIRSTSDLISDDQAVSINGLHRNTEKPLYAGTESIKTQANLWDSGDVYFEGDRIASNIPINSLRPSNILIDPKPRNDLKIPSRHFTSIVDKSWSVLNETKVINNRISSIDLDFESSSKINFDTKCLKANLDGDRTNLWEPHNGDASINTIISSAEANILAADISDGEMKVQAFSEKLNGTVNHFLSEEDCINPKMKLSIEGNITLRDSAEYLPDKITASSPTLGFSNSILAKSDTKTDLGYLDITSSGALQNSLSAFDETGIMANRFFDTSIPKSPEITYGTKNTTFNGGLTHSLSLKDECRLLDGTEVLNPGINLASIETKSWEWEGVSIKDRTITEASLANITTTSSLICGRPTGSIFGENVADFGVILNPDLSTHSCLNESWNINFELSGEFPQSQRVGDLIDDDIMAELSTEFGINRTDLTYQLRSSKRGQHITNNILIVIIGDHVSNYNIQEQTAENGGIIKNGDTYVTADTYIENHSGLQQTEKELIELIFEVLERNSDQNQLSALIEEVGKGNKKDITSTEYKLLKKFKEKLVDKGMDEAISKVSSYFLQNATILFEAWTQGVFGA